MRLMHEFEEFVDDCLEEFPMSLEESRILSDNVHDIRSNDSLVVLSTFHFDETEQLLDDSDEESLLRLLI